MWVLTWFSGVCEWEVGFGLFMRLCESLAACPGWNLDSSDGFQQTSAVLSAHGSSHSGLMDGLLICRSVENWLSC